MKKLRHMQFPAIKSFTMMIVRNELDVRSSENEFNAHVHAECEVYVNLTGDVSFMVENTLYPIKHGDVIITRPYEYHRCIYHSDKPHQFFWMLFSSEGNEGLLTRFFDRNIGQDNLISLPPHLAEEVLRLCAQLVEMGDNAVRMHVTFLRFLDLLESEKGAVPLPQKMPEDVKQCITYINEHFTQLVTVKDLSRMANVSVNTLERHFKQVLGLSPYAYLQNRRLSNAAVLLKEGRTVLEASLESGFPDYSHFIVSFKKRYGKTPLEYKKMG